MLLRYIATVVAFSSLFPLASALPTVGTDATVSADLAVESLDPSLGDAVTNLIAKIAASTEELQVGPNDLTTPGSDAPPSLIDRIRDFMQGIINRVDSLFDMISSVVNNETGTPIDPSILSSLMTSSQNLLDEFLRLEPSVPNELNSPISGTSDVLKDLLDTLAKALARVSN